MVSALFHICRARGSGRFKRGKVGNEEPARGCNGDGHHAANAFDFRGGTGVLQLPSGFASVEHFFKAAPVELEEDSRNALQHPLAYLFLAGEGSTTIAAGEFIPRAITVDNA
jgi:hypothetical protein